MWILPSSWLSRVDPGSERMPFTSFTGCRGGSMVTTHESGRGDPPNRGIRIGRFDAIFSPILVLDLGARTAPRCPCTYRGVENAKNSYWYLEPLCLWWMDTESHLRIGEKNAHQCEKTLPKRSPANGYPKDITGVETRPFGAQRSYRMAVSLKCPSIAESDPNLVWSPLPCVLLKKGVTHGVSLCRGHSIPTF